MNAGGPTLGVLGGMGPAAGAELVALVTRHWPAERDQDHPRVILLSEPGIPDRTDALRGRAPDPTGPLHTALHRLAAWGADLIAIACNTAFAFLDPAGDGLPVPVVHTVSTAVAAARRQAPGGAWLLATDGTVESGLYQRCAAPLGYPLMLPGAAEQAAIARAVAAAKAGAVDEAGRLLAGAMTRLGRVSDAPFLLGCTDLPSAWRAAGRPGRVVDSLDALALACVGLLTAHATPAPPLPGGHEERLEADSAV